MMKPKRGWRAAGILSLVVAIGACDKGLTELNINPNDPVDVGAEYLFTNAVEAAVSRVTGAYLNLDITGLWIQHYVEHLYTEEDVYEIRESIVDGHWTNFYAGPLEDFQEVIMEGEELNRPNVKAMGMIMKAWTAQVVTDLWGDIAYSQALRGRDPDAPLTVEFDTQEEVYNQLLAEVTEAAAMIDPSAVRIERGDLIYGGAGKQIQMERWRKFANSLRMRMAMRLSEVAPARAQSEFVNAYQAGGFESNDDAAVLQYLDNGVNRHPIHVYELSRDDHSVSGTLIDTLKHLNDPRLPVYALPNKFGEYWGAPNGDMYDPELDSISRIGDFYSSADSKGVLMSYAELLFLQAEAAERGWIAADPAALYEAGIRAAMEFNKIDAAAIDAYLAQPVITYQGGMAGRRQIALQKWIALFGNGPEAYAEWRRTGWPELTPGPDAKNDGQIPRRLFYPASELGLNRAAVEAAKARQGGATLKSPVWWDVRQ